MKKIVALILLLCLMLSLSGCKSATEKVWDSTKDIRFTYDQNVVDEANKGK